MARTGTASVRDCEKMTRQSTGRLPGGNRPAVVPSRWPNDPGPKQNRDRRCAPSVPVPVLNESTLPLAERCRNLSDGKEKLASDFGPARFRDGFQQIVGRPTAIRCHRSRQRGLPRIQMLHR